MEGKSNSKASETDSNSPEVFHSSLKQKAPDKPLSEDIPNDLNKDIVVEFERVEEDAIVIDDRGNRIEDADEVSRFQIEVKNRKTGNPLPGLDVHISLIRREDGLKFGPYKFPFLCGIDSFCYSRDLQIPEGEYKLEAIIQPEKQHSRLEELVGEVRAVFTGVEID